MNLPCVPGRAASRSAATRRAFALDFIGPSVFVTCEHCRDIALSYAPRSPVAKGRDMKPVFLQLQCSPGKTYEVADTLFQREIVSELYSTSGEFDLLAKIYIAEDQDIGKFINENVLDIPNIIRSLTTLTFTAF
jgi:DNA-binding Lrp family transcriptional regulator